MTAGVRLVVQALDDGSVQEITFKDGGNQQILATLDNGDKVTATWVSGSAAPPLSHVTPPSVERLISSATL